MQRRDFLLGAGASAALGAARGSAGIHTKSSKIAFNRRI